VWKRALGAARTLWFDYGYLSTVLTGSCIDAERRPIPWYTYSAVEYLKQLDFSDSTVFEYGSGNSTLFWATRARRVVSVEDDEAWYRKLAPQLPANCELVLETDLRAYVDAITRYPHGFDVIVVDGAARGGTRLRCTRNAVPALRAGGMIVLDNSDWLPRSAALMREHGLIQVDMAGFTPIVARTQTTSLFLHRECRFPPRAARQPVHSPGAERKVWEHEPTLEAPVVEMDGELFCGVTRDESFEIGAPGGARRFRLIESRNSIAGPCAAIFDLDQQRVLISLTETTTDAPAPVDELVTATRMSWPRFCAFINSHDKKRYCLPHS
jgi:hypothetical protein